METGELIRAIASDAAAPGMPLRSAWRVAFIAAVILAATAFFAMLGLRPDIMQAAQSARFLFKFVVALSLAASAFTLVRALSRPAGGARARTVWLLATPLLLAMAIVLELLAVPSAQWMARLVGSNSWLCVTFIPLIGTGPLAIFLAALSYGAPTRPALSGAVAGLLAGAVGAGFYAAHCPDDSPLFVATWYTIAIAGLALAGALIAPRLIRW